MTSKNLVKFLAALMRLKLFCIGLSSTMGLKFLVGEMSLLQLFLQSLFVK